MAQKISEIISDYLETSEADYVVRQDNQYLTRLMNAPVNVKEFGAKGDGITDDTQAIQAADTAVANAGGGVVWFPSGIWRITSQVKPSKGVIWKGIGTMAGPQWNNGEWDTTNIGSVIAIDFGSGNTNIANAAILLTSLTTLDGLVFWYPNQLGDTSTPIQYPPTIALDPSGDITESSNSIVKPTIRNCVLVNPYIAIDATVRHELLTIQNVKFTAWHTGIKVDNSYDIDRLIDVHSNPNIMYRSNWPTNSNFKYHISDNTTKAYIIGKADSIQMKGCFSYGFYTGLSIDKIGDYSPNGVYVESCAFEGCGKPVVIIDSFKRIKFNLCSFGNHPDFGRQNAITIYKSELSGTNDEIRFCNCTVWRSYGSGVSMDYITDVMFDNCYFYNCCINDPGFQHYVIRVNQCKNVIFNNCALQTSTAHTNTGYFEVKYTTLAFLKDLRMSDCQKTGSSQAITNSTSIRVDRRAYSNTVSNTIYQDGNTDVVIDTDTINY